MRDRVQQAKARIEKDIENVRTQFKNTLEQRGRLTQNLHSLITQFEEEKKQLDEKIYDVQVQDMKLQAQLEALKSLG